MRPTGSVHTCRVFECGLDVTGLQLNHFERLAKNAEGTFRSISKILQGQCGGSGGLTGAQLTILPGPEPHISPLPRFRAAEGVHRLMPARTA